MHYVVIHKISKKEVIIADPAVGIVKLSPEEFFGVNSSEGKPAKYQWTGVLILLTKNETFKKGKETKGLFSRFLNLLYPQKKIVDTYLRGLYFVYNFRYYWCVLF